MGAIYTDSKVNLNSIFGGMRWDEIGMVGNDGTRRRYFQHAHSIPIVGVGKRGAY